MLSINNIIKTFPDKTIKYPSVKINSGELVLIIGASGCGKSTLCEMITGFLPTESGEILINNTNVKKMNVFKHIHYLSQFPEHNLIGPTWADDLELWEQSDAGNREQGTGNNPSPMSPCSAITENSDKCSFAPPPPIKGETTPLPVPCSLFPEGEGNLNSELSSTPVWKLSFGQKKALSFCALEQVHRDIWILDEPFAGLDTKMVEKLIIIVNDHVLKGGIVIITSHEEVKNFKVGVRKYEL